MDEADEAHLDWKKLKENSEKIGLREGIDEGRNSNFQQSFDEGYKSGFRNGFELGKLKALLKGENHSSLAFTKRGNCSLCKDQSLMEKSNEEKNNLQWTSTQSLMASLK